MKNRKTMLIIALSVFAIMGLILAVLARFDTNANTITIPLYFFNAQQSTISTEMQDIRYYDEDELPSLVLDSLIKGPTDSRNSKIMSNKVKVLSIEKDSGDNLTVDFSREYYSGNTAQDILSTYAVVKSLCELNDIYKVKITVEKQDIVSADGSVIGFLASNDIKLQTEEAENSSNYVSLYFASEDSSALVREVHKLKATDDKLPIEQLVVTELINGPKNKELVATLSPDTSLISAETKDGICYVNFKLNFIDKNSGSHEKALLAVYSIVNSLTELHTVSQVQFLIDGKKVEQLGNIAFSEVFVRNEECIRK